MSVQLEPNVNVPSDQNPPNHGTVLKSNLQRVLHGPMKTCAVNTRNFRAKFRERMLKKMQIAYECTCEV